MPSPDLSDSSILITGAGRGLGRSMAAKLAACGARIALVDVDAASCQAAARTSARVEGVRRPCPLTLPTATPCSRSRRASRRAADASMR